MPTNPYGNTMNPQTPEPKRPSPFATLLGGGLAGFGKGMMSPSFRTAYNAGQSGFQDVLGAQNMRQRFRDDKRKGIVDRTKLQADLDEFDRLEALNRASNP